MKRRTATLFWVVSAAIAWLPRPAVPQQSPTPLTLREALAAAHRVSPELAAARAVVEAAAARTRQAGALTNPTLSYGYEQTSAAGLTLSQSVAALEQPLELTGVRGARRDAARLRRLAADAELRAVEARITLDLTRAYAMAQAANERMNLAARAAEAFDRAHRVTGERLAQGDVSGYEARRIRLEVARYAALRAEAGLARRTAYVTLASLVDVPVDSLVLAGVASPDTALDLPAQPHRDSLLAHAVQQRPELLAAERLASAALADGRAARRERLPIPVAMAGWKGERATTGGGRLGGFVAGLSLPLPLWDRREGAVAAADAGARSRAAEVDLTRRRVVREVEEALAALAAARDAVARLGPAVGADAAAALRAAEAAYAEGEIPLLAWLDAVRSWHEAESILVTLRAELHIRRAALAHAAGDPRFEERRP